MRCLDNRKNINIRTLHVTVMPPSFFHSHQLNDFGPFHTLSDLKLLLASSYRHGFVNIVSKVSFLSCQWAGDLRTGTFLVRDATRNRRPILTEFCQTNARFFCAGSGIDRPGSH